MKRAKEGPVVCVFTDPFGTVHVVPEGEEGVRAGEERVGEVTVPFRLSFWGHEGSYVP